MVSRRQFVKTVGVGATVGMTLPTVQAQTTSTEFTQQQKLAASDGDSDDAFGAVAVDGDTAVVGAYNDEDPNGSTSGSAYIFIRQNGTWTQQQKLTPDDGTTDDRFGGVVALSGDTAVVGAVSDDNANGSAAGSAYVFTRSNGTWSQQQKLTPDDGDSGDAFGVAVGLSGETAIIGASRDNTSNASQAGSAYVFTRTSGEWTQQQKLVASNSSENDRFGRSIAVDNGAAVIGAPIASNEYGDFAGRAYLFTQSDGSWSQQQELTVGDEEIIPPESLFGESVAISGNRVVVGAPGYNSRAGAAYVFTNPDTGWSYQQKVVPASSHDSGDRFGVSVAVSGGAAVVGAYHDADPNGSKAGSAYVFTQSNNTWTQQQKLAPDSGDSGDWFGATVALTSDTALIGAVHDEDPNGQSSGSVYVYDYSGGGQSGDDGSNQSGGFEPGSVPAQYDSNNDGSIALTELSQAAVDYAGGGISLSEMAQIATAYATT